MPFLNKRVLDVRGKRVVIDNPIAPPPMMSNPSRRTSMRGHRQSFDKDWRYAFGDIPSTLLKYLPKTDCDGKSSSSLIS